MFLWMMMMSDFWCGISIAPVHLRVIQLLNKRGWSRMMINDNWKCRRAVRMVPLGIIGERRDQLQARYCKLQP
jgi:hypothetical protein